MPKENSGLSSIEQSTIRVSEKIESCMDKEDLIPEVLDSLPLTILSVKFMGCPLTPRAVLKPKSVKLLPEIEWKDEHSALYTICMIDPDAPSRSDHRFREFLHWLVVNVPINRVKKGTTIVEYIGACPARGTGLHRYVILVFRQKVKLICEERKINARTAFGRAMFSNKAFARKYKLGLIVAGNMFLSEWDEYVPKLYRRLHFCEGYNKI